MKIQSLPLSRINAAPYNPRKDLQPSDPEFQKLKLSIEQFGCVEPLVWNKRSGHLVGGHQRFKVLVAGGATQVDVSVVDLSPEREKALNIALNKIMGGWDEQKLAQLLDELTRIPEFNIELTGFDVPEASELIAEILHSSTDVDEQFDVDAALDRSKPAITKAGEVIVLGRHRLTCGDSSDPESLKRLFGSTNGAHLLFTDPPYNVNYYGGDRPIPDKARPKQSKQWERIYGDNLTQEVYSSWLGKVLANADEHLLPGACSYIWNGHRQFGPMYLLLEKAGYKISCVITWAKESFAIGYGDYNQQTEFCLYAWKPPRKKKNGGTRGGASGGTSGGASGGASGGHRWYGPTNESTLWTVRRDPTKSYEHPTQKPLELAERAIRNSSKPGQVVLDCFLGSGTTLLASERTGRCCVGVEIDPHYCDVIVRRYLAYVHQRGLQAPAELSKRYGSLQPAPRKPRAAIPKSHARARSSRQRKPQKAGAVR